MASVQKPTKPRIVVDVGSSTIKVHRLEEDGQVKYLKNQSIPFKNNFDPQKGLALENKQKLFDFVDQIKNEYTSFPIKIYATAIFRKLEPLAKRVLLHEFFERTRLYLNIVEQDLENFYLEKALVGKAEIGEPLLLINIGGGSTELVLIKDREVVERKNLDLGVGTVNEKFPGINSSFSQVSLGEVAGFIKDFLPPLSSEPRVAFYSGGELTYMKLALYPLIPNLLFADSDHPTLIHFSDFQIKNQKVFQATTLEQLEGLMPENPSWMHGARGCSAIAQAIGEKYGLEFLIPSDSNLAHGVNRQELRSITLSGSFRKHLPYILEVKKVVEEMDIKVLSPRFAEPKNPGEEFVVFTGEEGLSPLALERYHLESIEKSDALIVCDPQGYVGASALIEIGFAQSLGKRIIFTEKPEEFMLNTLPAEIGF